MKLAKELARKYSVDQAMGDPLDAINEAIDRAVSEAKAVMDSDEMYDLLPGDGQDDFIIGEFNRMLDARIKALKEGK